MSHVYECDSNFRKILYNLWLNREKQKFCDGKYMRNFILSVKIGTMHLLHIQTRFSSNWRYVCCASNSIFFAISQVLTNQTDTVSLLVTSLLTNHTVNSSNVYIGCLVFWIEYTRRLFQYKLTSCSSLVVSHTTGGEWLIHKGTNEQLY